MKFQNNRYTVVTKVETAPSLDNFDAVHNPEAIDITRNTYMARVIQIEQQNGTIITVALLGTIFSSHEPCASLADNMLTVLLFNAIVRLDLDTGSIVQYVKCFNTGGLYEIHPVDQGYIVWSECEILRYDLNLKQIWCFAGRDILVSRSLGRSFWIERELIHCIDWMGWHYILTNDGNLISDTRDILLVE